MANVNELIPHILKWEGGFVDDPDDPGGATNMGITMRTYQLYCRRKGYPSPSVERLKAIDLDTFRDILKSMYWDTCKADDIQSQSVANLIVDWGWNSGTHTAVKRVQRLLGVKTDGVVGPITLAAINSRSPLPLFGQIKTDRMSYIEEICASRPANNKYKRGWYNRIKDFQFED